jgi:hypothetical protein
VVGINFTAVCKNNIKADDVVESETPQSGVVTVASMESVATNTDTAASSVGQSTLSLVENTLGEIT